MASSSSSSDSENEQEHNEQEHSDDGAPNKSGKKAPAFSELEKQTMIELVNQYKLIIEDKRTDYGTNNKKAKAWDAISGKFSSQHGVQKRSAMQLKNWWLNSKKRAKKDVSSAKISDITFKRYASS